MSDLPEYILDREFDAPRTLVWKAWTDPDLLARWYGPGVETTIHKFELKPGGLWLNEMKWGEKSDLSRMEFKEVVAEEKLVWLHASADANWEIAANPMMADWPRLLRTTVTFQESDGKTNVRLSMVPVDASPAEIACFSGAMSGLNNGWGKGFEVMAELLKELV